MELRAQCLVSELVYEVIELPPDLEARSVGELELRGRTEPLHLYSVERARRWVTRSTRGTAVLCQGPRRVTAV